MSVKDRERGIVYCTNNDKKGEPRARRLQRASCLTSGENRLTMGVLLAPPRLDREPRLPCDPSPPPLRRLMPPRTVSSRVHEHTSSSTSAAGDCMLSSNI